MARSAILEVIARLDGGATAVQIVTEALRAIEARDRAIGAFACRLEGQALATAARIDRIDRRERSDDAAPRPSAGRTLAGVPYAVKANFAVAGLATTGNSWSCDPAPASRDAAALQRLAAAGAVLVGTTAMSEWAFGGTIGGRLPPVRHPHDTLRYAGGSSSGSAAAVAAGFVAFALGSDTAGSIRVPAAWCGLVGYKPSRSRVDSTGLHPLAPSLDSPGILATDVGDTQRVAAALGIVGAPATRPHGVRGLRIGRLAGNDAASPGERALSRWLDRLAAAGAIVSPAPPLDLAGIGACTATLLCREARQSLAHALADTHGRTGALLRARLDAAADITDAAYAQALRRRDELAAAINALAAGCDVLVAATTPTAAPRMAAINEQVPLPPSLLMPCNLADLPALSLPCGVDDDGMPLGAQLAVRTGEDTALLDIALAIEAIAG